jgi:hypothetical protein
LYPFSRNKKIYYAKLGSPCSVFRPQYHFQKGGKRLGKNGTYNFVMHKESELEHQMDQNYNCWNYGVKTEQRPLGRPRPRWKDSIVINHREMHCQVLTCSEYGAMVDFYLNWRIL